MAPHVVRYWESTPRHPDPTFARPAAIEWELGVRSGVPPFATYVGERRCTPPGPSASVAASEGSGG